jgi:hypothetical protein
MKKVFLLVLIIYYFACFSQTYALGESIKITEIMYDVEGTDTDHEWIEIQNISSSDINLSGWKFNDGSNHGLNEPPMNGGQGSLIIQPQSFVIISPDATQFLSDFPSFLGTVIDSVMSLSNSGDTIKIIDQAGLIVDEVTYNTSLGANGDGNTLSWYQNGWVVALKNPGSQTIVQNTNNTQTSISTQTTQETAIKTTTFTDSTKTKVWSLDIIPSTQSIFTDTPFLLTPKVLNTEQKERNIGKFIYNLGDGRLVKTLSSEPISVVYPDPGSYIIYLEFYHAESDPNPVVSDKLLISVEEPPILISLDNNDKQKIIISNLHSGDIDISNWVLTDGLKEFIFPKNTFLPSKRKVILNPLLHNLNTSHLVLETSIRQIVSVYPQKVKTVSVVNTVGNLTSSNKSLFISEKPIAELNEGINPLLKSEDISSNKNKASVLDSGFVVNEWIVIFFIILIFGVIIFNLFLKESDNLNRDGKTEKIELEILE